MDYFRKTKIDRVNNKEVVIKEDYLESKRFSKEVEIINLPKSNVIKFILSDGSWFVLRPSGTEPKLKIYIGVVGSAIDVADLTIKDIKDEVLKIIDNI